jgi:hypothetical protein
MVLPANGKVGDGFLWQCSYPTLQEVINMLAEWWEVALTIGGGAAAGTLFMLGGWILAALI